MKKRRAWLRAAAVAACALASIATSKQACPWSVNDAPIDLGCAKASLTASRGRHSGHGAHVTLLFENPGAAVCKLTVRSVSIERGATATPESPEVTLEPGARAERYVWLPVQGVNSGGDGKNRLITVETDQGTLQTLVRAQCGGCL